MKPKKRAKTILRSRKNSLHNKKAPKTSFSKERTRLLLFVIKFFAIFGVANVLIELADLSALNFGIASLTAGLSGLAAGGNIILAGQQAFVITNFCTGLVSVSILGAIIFSLSKPELKKKLLLFFAGTGAILLVNIPRIVLVLSAAKAGFDAEIVHEATWFVMSGVILLIWYYGTKRITKVEEFSGLV